jgi:hypothetical protein
MTLEERALQVMCAETEVEVVLDPDKVNGRIVSISREAGLTYIEVVQANGQSHRRLLEVGVVAWD